MITDKWIKELNRLNNRYDTANEISQNLSKLNISNKSIENKLKSIESEYYAFHKAGLDYLLSLIPTELRQQLNVTKTFGLFVSDITGTISFNAVFSLMLDPYEVITLKYDRDNKCLYHQSWRESEYATLLDKYLKNNPSFNSRIRIKQ